MNSIELCKIIKRMEEGLAYHGEFVEMRGKVDFFVGGTVVFSRRNEVKNIERKIEAGFDFFQSQITYDPVEVVRLFEEAEKANVRLNKPIFIGLTPISSKRMLENILRIPFIEVPGKVEDELRKTEDIREKSLEICFDVADELRAQLGHKYRIGFHVMPLWNDELGRVLVEGLR